MTDFDIAVTAVAAVATAEGAALYVAYLVERRDAIAAGWVEGVEWVAAHRPTLPRVDARAALATAELWVLEHTLRAHGHHRRAVTS